VTYFWAERLISVGLCFAALAAAGEIFVAPNGDDRNPGTKARPLATLERARDAVRQVKGGEAVTVWVRRGTYYLHKPLVLGPADSGTPDHPVTYSAYEGEEAVLSGARRLTCAWKPFRDGIFECSLPEVRGGRLDFTQLFINGKRRIRARFPNYDPREPGVTGYATASGNETVKSRTEREIPYEPATFSNKAWARPEGAVIDIFPQHYWGNQQYHLLGIDRDRHVLRLGQGGQQLNEMWGATWFKDAWFGPKSRYFIENVFEELDAPGEWYLDKRDGVLYYKPEAGLNLTQAKVEAPLLKQLIEFKGTQDNPVRYITFKGFRVTGTASTYLDEYEWPSGGDWTIYRGGAFSFEGTEYCAIENDFFDGVGGNAIFLSNYNRRGRIYGNKFTQAGDSAICLVGSKRLVVGTNLAYPSETLISNNLIHDIGVFGKQVAAVMISVSGENTVSHNVMYNLPRAAININDGWYGGNVVEYNDIWETVRETSDHGPFNSWGRERYWCAQQSHGPVSHGAGDVKADAVIKNVVRNNRFRDRHGWGIDLDDGSSNFHVYNNLCIGIGIKLREGDYRLVENNIIIHPALPPGFHVGYEFNHDRFVRNIIVTDSRIRSPIVDVNFSKDKGEGDAYLLFYPPAKGRILEEVDYNLFFSDTGRFTATVVTHDKEYPAKHYTLEQWQAEGYDIHSLFADPLFVNAAAGDYTLRPDSPALKLGFRSLDLTGVGLLPDFPKKWRD